MTTSAPKDHLTEAFGSKFGYDRMPQSFRPYKMAGGVQYLWVVSFGPETHSAVKFTASANANGWGCDVFQDSPDLLSSELSTALSVIWRMGSGGWVRSQIEKRVSEVMDFFPPEVRISWYGIAPVAFGEGSGGRVGKDAFFYTPQVPSSPTVECTNTEALEAHGRLTAEAAAEDPQEWLEWQSVRSQRLREDFEESLRRRQALRQAQAEERAQEWARVRARVRAAEAAKPRPTPKVPEMEIDTPKRRAIIL